MAANDLERRLAAAGLKVRVDAELKATLLGEGVPDAQAEDQAVYVAVDHTVRHLCDDGEEVEAITRRPGFWVDEDGDGFTGGKPEE